VHNFDKFCHPLFPHPTFGSQISRLESAADASIKSLDPLMMIMLDTTTQATTEPVLVTSEDSASARKRRIQLRAMQREDLGHKRPRYEETGEDDDVSVTSSMMMEGVRTKPSIRGIKKQARYEPGVNMTREELAAWRKEARRVRNRESAAASRRKTRDRIEQLEHELSELQSKYSQALQRIVELEQNGQHSEAFTPRNLQESRPVSPSVSTTSSPLHGSSDASSTAGDDVPFLSLHESASTSGAALVSSSIHHQMTSSPSHIHMISRPTAVCVRVSP
jgi:hypothetical protein